MRVPMRSPRDEEVGETWSLLCKLTLSNCQVEFVISVQAAHEDVLLRTNAIELCGVGVRLESQQTAWLWKYVCNDSVVGVVPSCGMPGHAGG